MSRVAVVTGGASGIGLATSQPGSRGQAHYSASKGGVIVLTKTLAVEEDASYINGQTIGVNGGSYI